jgi:methylated-DNA-[protein]-cysteine S-methyltransferase
MSMSLDVETEQRLHERLIRAAAADGLLDVAYRTVDTPIGALFLAATERGLVKVAFGRDTEATVLEVLARRISPRILRAPSRLDPFARQLDEYFAGARRTFDVPLDFQLASGFRLEVLHHLRQIAYGRTESYAQVAAAAGSPRAVRAAGTACATNPLPIVVPCHRVVRSDGSFGAYGGGPEVKRILLELEGVA